MREQIAAESARAPNHGLSESMDRLAESLARAFAPITMQTIRGIAVSPGVAIGVAFIFENERDRVPLRRITLAEIDSEWARFEQAEQRVAQEIESRGKNVTEQLGAQYGAIFLAHEQMLRDPQLHRGIRDCLQRESCSIEYAVSHTLRQYAEVFQRSTNHYLAERAQDIFDLEKLLLAELLGNRRRELHDVTEPIILLSHGLTPSETANLDRDRVLGFVTETGGAGGHVAIVAEALEIPAVVGTGNFLAVVNNGDLLIVDGGEGKVILHPDAATVTNYRARVAARDQQAVHLSGLRDLPAETKDGHRIELLANIEFPYEAESCRLRGAEGIGLYRTEFLYLGNSREPTEEEQTEAYCHVARAMGDYPVVIRTLDLGADKMVNVALEDEQRNPFLGLRSIRLSLRYPEIFRRQLRAILRASVGKNLRVMFPLVSTLSELTAAISELEAVQRELDEESIPYDRHIPVGIMVEVPSAVIMLDQWLDKVDFISIGTNDLVQYALAVDRSNKEVAGLYSNSDPAILRLIHMACQTAQSRNVPVSVCGQMSADPKYLMPLIGLGITTLSIPPFAIPEIKRTCRAVSLEACRQLAEHALQLDTADSVRQYLQRELNRVMLESLNLESPTSVN